MADKSTIEAIEKLLAESPERSFSESVDLAINLKNLDMSQPKNRVDEEILLPHGRGKDLKIAVFAKGEVGLQAKEAGADRVFSEEELSEIGDDKTLARSIANEFDFFIAEVQYMAQIGKSLGAILGPRGKMPAPLQPGKSVSDLIRSARGSIRIRSKDKKTFHVPVGRRDMDTQKLAENVETVLSRVENSLDKGKHNIKAIYVTTTMGRSVRVL